MNQTIRNLLLLCPRGGFKVTDVPQSEGDALMVLYNAGGGAAWTDNTGWGTDPVVDNWYGVTVAGGHVTQLDISNNNGNGNVSAFDLSALPSATRIYLHANAFSGDVTAWAFGAVLERLYLGFNSFSGDVTAWLLPATMTQLYLYINAFTGDLSSLVIPAGLEKLRIYQCGFTGVPDLSSNTALEEFYYADNGLAQADVDVVLAAVYARRATFTAAAPALDIGGDDATPSGAYVDEDPPTTGLGYAFELANDPEVEGFNTWSITYNGGAGDVTVP